MKTTKLYATLALLLIPHAGFAQAKSATEMARLQKIADRVTITRDDWGIAHVHGPTDADATFGMIYAQAEDDFNRVEVNYLNALGRMAEAEGESAVWTDLRQRLFINFDTLKAQYAISSPQMKAVMNGWADGLNYFIATHPNVKPRVLTHFEPWMALSFSEGSICCDIERVSPRALHSHYCGVSLLGATEESFELAWVPQNHDDTELPPEVGPRREPTGSNGAAVAPKNTATGHALLLINPHTSFFFRSELHETSDEGLNAYGAATWGQLFIYQGWNPRMGWMHTSSGVDNIDEFLETVSQKGDKFFAKHGDQDVPLAVMPITIAVKTPAGIVKRDFVTYRSMHGPIVRKQGDKLVSVALMNSPAKALEQSYMRTKAKTYAEFQGIMESHHTNSSNNTIYADADGNIAYWHSNYIPRRNPQLDWLRPVDGSDPATDYHGLLSVDETPKLFNPASGWLYNSNNWPWSAAGPSSPKREDFPKYVETGGESARGLHAIKVLSARTDFNVQRLIDAAYDGYQMWFENRMPALIAAYDATPASNPLKSKVAEQIEVLRAWDLRANAKSVPTSLAIYWGEQTMRIPGFNSGNATSEALLTALSSASDRLIADFGTWKTPWGDINRFQRLTDDIVHPFTDAGPSIPVEFTSATWGSLASFGARTYPGTKKRYGTSGNSFVAVVEFGDSVRARAVTAGGESGDPKSKHFNDQAERYATGNLREVYFYPSQLKGHTERVYHPGQ
jgi:acyl-homoserine lactone acylase PvdQ